MRVAQVPNRYARCPDALPPLAANFSLHGSVPASTHSVVNRLKPIVALMLLTLFAFASSHPLLESLELIHHDDAHAEGPTSSDHDHDAADGLCQINSHRNELQRSLADSFDFSHCLVLGSLFLQPETQGVKPRLLTSSSPPPELGTTWQFSARAALPVRAPSIAS